MEGGDEEEYAIEGHPPRKLLDTPEGLQRRRARLYYDRTDFRGKCLYFTCCFWTSLFLLEDFLKAVLLVGCGVVGEYTALKQGKSLDAAVGEGLGFGILCYISLFILSEIGYRLSDNKTTRRAVRDETSVCSLFNYLVVLVLLFAILGSYIAVHEYCVEGVSCTLPSPPSFLTGKGGA